MVKLTEHGVVLAADGTFAHQKTRFRRRKEKQKPWPMGF